MTPQQTSQIVDCFMCASLSEVQKALVTFLAIAEGTVDHAPLNEKNAMAAICWLRGMVQNMPEPE